MNNVNLNDLRRIDLYLFLKKFDPNGWKNLNTHQLIGIRHDSCIVTIGKGWSWFSRGLFSRNTIEFLILYYELSFKEAVKILREVSSNTIMVTSTYISSTVKRANPIPYKEDRKPWRELYSYMCSVRCISKNIVDDVINMKLLYQTSGKFPNLCFINLSKTHFEIVGTGIYRFKRISDGSKYWILPFSSNRCYLCESAIDAISLYELVKDETASYISVGGSLSRTKLIQKVINEFHEVILAIDNDEAADKTAILFPLLKRIIPLNKDFNEDLIMTKTQNKKYEYQIKKAGVL